MKKLAFSTLKDKNVKYGGYATLITIAVLVGIVIINLIAGQFPMEIDMTEKKLFSLTDQTLKVLENLEEDITVYGLYKVGEEAEDIVAVLRRYENASENIRLEFIDPDKNPTFVQKYDPEGKGVSPSSLIVKGSQDFRHTGCGRASSPRTSGSPIAGSYP